MVLALLDHNQPWWFWLYHIVHCSAPEKMGRSPQSFLLAALFLVSSIASSAAQDQACASKLTGCASYLNSTNPPASCCDPLKDAVTNDLPCMCSLLRSPDLFGALGINITQALGLSTYCGITSGVEACNSVTTNGTSPTPTPPSKDGASSIAWMGMSGLVTLFLFFWSIIG